jgi:hypothetical protein
MAMRNELYQHPRLKKAFPFYLYAQVKDIINYEVNLCNLIPKYIILSSNTCKLYRKMTFLPTTIPPAQILPYMSGGLLHTGLAASHSMIL